MKILLTGGSGLVGSNVKLYHANKNITHEILSPTRTELNLLDRESIRNYLESNLGIELVIHAAGFVGGVHKNKANPTGFMYENMTMGMNLLMESYRYGIKNFINLGSSCMYPKNAELPINEDSILTGALEPTNEGYAIAKSVVTKMCEYLGYNYKTIIPCNLYGKYDKFRPEDSHMLASAIRKLHLAKESGEKVTIWGDGTARREFMYAEDVADFIWYCVDRMDSMPRKVNLGLGKDYSIQELYDTAANIIGYTNGFEYDTSKPVGVKKKQVSIDRLKYFGWEHKTTLEEGIKQTYEFYKVVGDRR